MRTLSLAVIGWVVFAASTQSALAAAVASPALQQRVDAFVQTFQLERHAYIVDPHIEETLINLSAPVYVEQTLLSNDWHWWQARTYRGTDSHGASVAYVHMTMHGSSFGYLDQWFDASTGGFEPGNPGEPLADPPDVTGLAADADADSHIRYVFNVLTPAHGATVSAWTTPGDLAALERGEAARIFVRYEGATLFPGTPFEITHTFVYAGHMLAVSSPR